MNIQSFIEYLTCQDILQARFELASQVTTSLRVTILETSRYKLQLVTIRSTTISLFVYYIIGISRFILVENTGLFLDRPMIA
jgi:hypothetical protein